MAATTLINVTINLVHNGYHYGDKAFIYGIWAVWWVNVAATLWISFGLIHTLCVQCRTDAFSIETDGLSVRRCTTTRSTS